MIPIGKRYNTPHRSHVVKTRMTKEEYADFTERLKNYDMSQAEFIRQAIARATIRPIVTVSPVNDELLSAVGKLIAEYGKIGGNLNQIARALNEYGTPYNTLSVEVRAAISDLAALKFEVLRKVGDAVGNIQALRLFLLAVHSSNTQNIKSINAETINCFSTAMSNASEICMNVRRARCRQVGAYLHWLYDHKYTDLDYSLQLPNFKRTAPQIPQVWSPEEIDKILAVIDTANPVGRRNYAIFLLLARTGLRISDVLGLKFSNINWKENCISLSQQKTGNALSLPLSKELGMAIISYLQDGRPQSSSAFIFLSHNAPFQPLGEHNNFNPEFHKYLRRAGIAIPTKRHTGVHTIRHSFATNMLRKGTPVQDVSQILGHSNISVTETYLRVDIEHMRLCSLSLEGLL